jgi:hypothetical protein
VKKLIAGESTSVDESVNARTKDTSLERLSVIPTVSDCAELKLNTLSSVIEKESLCGIDTDRAGESANEMFNALGLSPTKYWFLLSGSSLMSVATSLTNERVFLRSTKDRRVVEDPAVGLRDASSCLSTVRCRLANDTDIVSAISQNHLLR